MNFYNVEIKAKSFNIELVREILNELGADFIGQDYQVDTYYKTKLGRLKVRKGNIENFLIYYVRNEDSDIKKSEVIREELDEISDLSKILLQNLEIIGQVKKRREIYFAKNVKFHLDLITNLGEFVEIEAKNESGRFSAGFLHNQCNEYMNLFKIRKEDIINCSYIDLITKQNSSFHIEYQSKEVTL